MSEVPPDLNVAVNLGGLGDIDMHTGLTLAAGGTLASAGATFASQWQAHYAKIKAEEAAIGGGAVLGDLLSEQFRRNYEALVTPVVEGANGVAPMIDQTAGALRSAVSHYLNLDGRVDAALRAANQVWL